MPTQLDTIKRIANASFLTYKQSLHLTCVVVTHTEHSWKDGEVFPAVARLHGVGDDHLKAWGFKVGPPKKQIRFEMVLTVEDPSNRILPGHASDGGVVVEVVSALRASTVMGYKVTDATWTRGGYGGQGYTITKDGD